MPTRARDETMQDRMDVDVEHEPDRSRFVVRTDEGDAHLLYSRPEEGLLDLRSTYVPGRLRGRGIGEALVLTALDHAREEDLEVIPTCWFVDTVLDRKPGYRDLVRGR